VVDTLSTGAESALIIEKLCALIGEGLPFDTIVEKIKDYMATTHLIFALESMHNLANNGRVSPLVAKFAGALGIRVIGKASSVAAVAVTDEMFAAEILKLFAE
jgi:fatty acid-binding protein DegV